MKGRIALYVLIIILVLVGVVRAETYWFPFVDNSPAPNPGNFWSGIVVTALYNGTTVYIDKNYNGVLDAGEKSITLSAGETKSFDNLPNGKAVKLVSNKPIQAVCSYLSNDWGVYDDNSYRYPSVPLGTKFVIPFSIGTVYITATKDNTRISINGVTKYLNKGQIYSISASSGMIITSDKPIGVVLINNNKNSQDSSFATPIYPTSYFGTNFWIPSKLNLMYKGIRKDNRMIYVVYENGRVKTFAQPSSVTHYTTSSPAMLYCLFDVYAHDPWDGMKHYMHAHPIPPINALDTEYVAGGYIISTHDNNVVQIDSNYDGVFESSVVLNAGEVYNPPQRRSDTPYPILYVKNLGHVKASYPLLNIFVEIGNWDHVDEETSSFLANGVKRSEKTIAKEAIEGAESAIFEAKSMSLNPEEAVNKLNQAKQEFSNGNYDKAVELAKDVLKLKEVLPEFEKSMSAIDKAESMSLNPTDAINTLEQAKQELSNGDYDKAMKLAEEAYEIATLMSSAEKAIEGAESAIFEAKSMSLNPEEAVNKLNQAKQEFSNGNYDKAVELANQAYSLAIDVDKDGIPNEKDFAPSINNNYIYATSAVSLATIAISAKAILGKLRKRRIEKRRQKEIIEKIHSLKAKVDSLAIGASYVKSILSEVENYVKSKDFNRAVETISSASYAIRELEFIGEHLSRWKREGYFFSINESNLKTIEADYERVGIAVERAKRIEEELKTIQFLEIPEINALYTKIKNNLKDLSKIDEVERDFATLKQMVEERRKFEEEKKKMIDELKDLLR